VTLTTHPHLVSRSMSRSYSPLPIISCMAIAEHLTSCITTGTLFTRSECVIAVSRDRRDRNVLSCAWRRHYILLNVRRKWRPVCLKCWPKVVERIDFFSLKKIVICISSASFPERHD
jgi:hypothetical protein